MHEGHHGILDKTKDGLKMSSHRSHTYGHGRDYDHEHSHDHHDHHDHDDHVEHRSHYGCGPTCNVRSGDAAFKVVAAVIVGIVILAFVVWRFF